MKTRNRKEVDSIRNFFSCPPLTLTRHLSLPAVAAGKQERFFAGVQS
jgi:hypothetical protein